MHMQGALAQNSVKHLHQGKDVGNFLDIIFVCKDSFKEFMALSVSIQCYNERKCTSRQSFGRRGCFGRFLF